MCRHRLRATISAVVVATALVEPLPHAQTPERNREVKLPWMDLSLKEGWQLLFRQGCRFAVPGSWHTDADNGFAQAPDGSNISLRTFKIANWSVHKAQIKAAFGHVNVMHEDSNRRLWFEIGSQPRVQHYLDVLHGLSVCSALLEMRGELTTPDVEDTVMRIVDSVGAAPDKWPPAK